MMAVVAVAVAIANRLAVVVMLNRRPVAPRLPRDRGERDGRQLRFAFELESLGSIDPSDM